uniref:putative disease resistance RPP13-like protein 1 n=1 Tax=Erigeron canadensis TaxID=72917 RepID=UPI001CB8C14C|nr:putative disease resistance RPP13-like protein 1 [Erigeron canadensis]
MAEIIATELIKTVFQKLGDEALKQIVRAQGIQSEIKNLDKTLSRIQDLLNDAADKETADKDVKKWLNSLHHLAYDIDDLLDGLATGARELTEEESGATTSKVTKRFIPTCCTNFKLSSKLHHKLDSIATELRILEKQKVSLGLNIKKDEKEKMVTSRKYETSLPDLTKFVGREREKKELLHKLLGDENPCKEKFSVVPIVGMGGVGKTTLARSLYNETQVKDHFELRVWICVSDDFDIFKISETIFRAMPTENKEFKDLNEIQIALSEQLKDKRFLLVLDDIWSEKYVDWENLVKPFHSGAAGSKIIMTTRKEVLLKQIVFGHLDKLETFSHDDAMSLLARHALDVDNFDSHTDLKAHGDCIVENCGCLPLALKVVGRLLRTKTDEQYWEQVLNSKIWQTDDNIVPALRLSYQELSACLKQLFAYCSFFPKDFLFDKRELVRLWVAEGFIKQSTGSTFTEESLGHKYFEELLSRSFFQHAPNDESSFVMHDLLIDLAKFVAEDFFVRLDDQMEMKTQTLAKYRHMSFIREKYVGYRKFKAFKSAKSLRTFLAVSVGVKESSDCFYLSYKILLKLLDKLPLLRVISLSGFEISEVPKCIVHLKHLRYLNLSQTKIEELPEDVGNLDNLQSLILFGCDKLRKLPKSFSKLNNLRHFDIRDTPLFKKMPFGIGDLSNLQTLTKIIIEGDNGFMISKLKNFKNLEGGLCIEGLDKVHNAKLARDARLSEKRLTEVEFSWNDVSNDSRNNVLEYEVLYELKPCHDALTILKIVSYPGTKFPNWFGDPSYLNLVHVSIVGCRNCTFLPVLGRLQLLKELVVEGMKEVKVIGPELLGIGGVAFPSLDTLRFKDMPSWEVWSTCQEVTGVVFPCLRELYIIRCHKLVDISLEALHSLRTLVIHGCGDGVLRSMVGVASSVIKLVINNISGLSDEVWRGVIINLRAVEQVWVYSCNEIRYMWKSEEEASKVLVNLRHLEVNGCSELVRLGEKEEDCSNLLTSLKILKLKDCDNLRGCSCPRSIDTLEIRNCSSIRRVSFQTREGRGEMETLKSLRIKDCKELVVMGKELVGGGKNTNNTQMLEYVYIEGWPNLKSMNGLLNSIHLTSLVISNCRYIESFPDLELPNLTSLTHLAIMYCPSMDGYFPRGNWPPRLTTLVIGGLKRPI